MPKTRPQKNQSARTSPKGIEQLLAEQTSVILNAVDERFAKQDQKMEARFAAQDKRIDERFASQDKRIEERFVAQNIALSAAMNKRLEQMEKRFTERLDRLTT